MPACVETVLHFMPKCFKIMRRPLRDVRSDDVAHATSPPVASSNVGSATKRVKVCVRRLVPHNALLARCCAAGEENGKEKDTDHSPNLPLMASYKAVKFALLRAVPCQMARQARREPLVSGFAPVGAAPIAGDAE